MPYKWILLSFLFLFNTLKAQTHVDVKIGVECWSFRDENEQLGHSKHNGQMIGVEVPVQDDRFLFIPGLHYRRISVENNGPCFSPNFDESDYLHYFTIPVLFGYETWKREDIVLLLSGGPEINFFYDLDENDAGYEQESMKGMHAGLQFLVQGRFFDLITEGGIF